MVLEPPNADHVAEDQAWWMFAAEVLEHVRIPHGVEDVTPSALPPRGVLLFACPPQATDDALTELIGWVQGGGVVVAVGGSGTLAERTGVQVGSTIRDGHVLVDAKCAGDIDVPLHAFGGVELLAPASARILARWSTPSSEAAAVSVDVGDGRVTVVGVDLWQSIVRILQGWPVLTDGTPAADGSAPIDDRILKSEDGVALSFECDRAVPPGQPQLPDSHFPYEFPPSVAPPFFHRPQADLWRRVFLRVLFDAADSAGIALPWLYYWPAQIPAVAHLSQDADGNVPEHAESALELFDELEIRTTWCHLYPGGYGAEIMDRIEAAGHEHALHYNAMADADIAQWGWRYARAQHSWLQATLGRERIVSNKNHYTRWEGWHELYLWCERLGIEIDQTRGGSKLGSAGFTFGTTHVWFPIADQTERNRRIDVLAMPLHTQDLALAGHESIRDVILDQALAEHGLAHFLFHPVHLHERDYVRSACVAVAQAARERGMPWWTSEQVNVWERARRQVLLSLREAPDGSLRLTVGSTQPIPDATVLISLPCPGEYDVAGPAGTPLTVVSVVERHGRPFLAVTLDLSAGEVELRIRAKTTDGVD